MLAITTHVGHSISIVVPPSPSERRVEVYLRGTKGARIQLAVDAERDVAILRRPDLTARRDTSLETTPS